jgi:hypothetical protein
MQKRPQDALEKAPCGRGLALRRKLGLPHHSFTLPMGAGYLVSVAEGPDAIAGWPGLHEKDASLSYGKLVYPNAKEDKDASEDGSRVVL